MPTIPAELMWSMVVDAMPLRVFWKDRESRYLGCNQHFAEDAKLASPSDIVGKLDFDLFDKDRADAFREDDRFVMETGSSKLAIEEEQQAIGGQRFWIETNKIPLRDANGDIVGVLGTYQDITVRKRMQSELVEAEQAKVASKHKSIFLANMSHEIRTPLNAILGVAQVLRSRITDPETVELIETILESGDTLLSVVNDVLDLSKIEAGKMDIAPTTGDIEGCLRRLISLWSPSAGEKGIGLSFDVQPDLPQYFSFDQVRVRQCVSNLISNALKFTERGSVSVRVTGEAASGDDWRIRIAVQDSGIGISEEAQGRLFSAFEQAEAGTARRFGGTGLGLSITRDLARLMDGNVTVSSREGEGATFIFTFVAHAIADHERACINADPSADKAAYLGLAGARVLLVDDHKVNRNVARALFGELFAEIVEAENGEVALDQLAQNGPFDLVLLDKHMPVLDGLSTIAAIREHTAPWRDVPVIALTADAMVGEREELLRLGMDGYATKPIDRDKLIGEALSVLSQRRDRAHGDAAA